MKSEQWTNIIYKILGEQAERHIYLDSNSSEKELRDVEKTCGTPLPIVVHAAIRHWKHQASEALLTTLPRLLNPSYSENELNPSGLTMQQLFPTFCRMLAKTESFGVVVDPVVNTETHDLNILFVGIGDRLVDFKSSNLIPQYWTCFAPKTIDEIKQYEYELRIKLSPQFRQMVMRVNGSPRSLPYFYPVERLDRGELADLYADFWTELDSSESFERLENFVAFYEDGTGNNQGFFPDEVTPDGEYTIYSWDHETVNFSVSALNFASWFERLLQRGW